MNVSAERETVTQKAIRSLKWSALIETLSRAIQPIAQLILARLLAPEDFGVVATAIIVINFSQVLWDVGLAKALIQTEGAIDKAANIVFWANTILGTVVYGLLFVGAPWIAGFLSSPASMPVLRVMGAQILISSLVSVQQALFIRDLSFRELFWIRLLIGFVPGSVSIPLALLGYGAWALVAGALTGSLVNLLLLWNRSSWRPSGHFDWRLARKLLRFGSWVVGESLIGWFMLWGDNLIVGKFLGIRELGIYQLGWTIVLGVFGLVLYPILPVLYPMISRLQDDMQGVRSAFVKANRIVYGLSLPVGVGLFLISGEIGDLFGERWSGLGLVVGIIGLLQSASWLVSINSEIYRAVGRPDVNTKLGFVLLVYYLPAFLVGAQLGFKGFVLTRLAVGLVSLPFNVYFCTRILGMSRWYIWEHGRPMILATIAMAASVCLFQLGLSTWVSSGVMVMLAKAGVGVTIYLFMLWLLDKPFVFQTLGLVRRAIR